MNERLRKGMAIYATTKLHIVPWLMGTLAREANHGQSGTNAPGLVPIDAFVVIDGAPTTRSSANQN
jgi:hypothetical protein